MALSDYIIHYKDEKENINDGSGTILVTDDDCILSFSLDNNNVFVSCGITNWVEYKDLSNTQETKVHLYINRNLTSKQREMCISFFNKKNGNVDTFFVVQEKCFYKIDCEIEEIDFKLKDEPIEIEFFIYGNTRKCNITDSNFSIKRKNNKYCPFDRGIGYKLIHKGNGKKESKEYSKYVLVINYIGNISDLNENDKYSVILQHADNRQTKINVDINISAVIKENNEEKIEKLFNDKTNKEIPSAISDYENQNNEGRNQPMKKNDMVSVNNIRVNMINTQAIVKLPSLVVNKIEGNVIYIQSNTYNRLNKLEHNSLVVGTKMTKWCTIDDIYDQKNEIHEIIVKCERNRFGIERKSYLILINAERLEGQKKFLVTQNKENEIFISEV